MPDALLGLNNKADPQASDPDLAHVGCSRGKAGESKVARRRRGRYDSAEPDSATLPEESDWTEGLPRQETGGNFCRALHQARSGSTPERRLAVVGDTQAFDCDPVEDILDEGQARNVQHRHTNIGCEQAVFREHWRNSQVAHIVPVALANDSHCQKVRVLTLQAKCDRTKSQ